PEVWLYRGAWQEWPIHEATWLGPLSQEELRLKIQAIFKHQAQKDSAPFPGGYDEREFWQRVEARNKGTAAVLDDLGLAEYLAMEACVVGEAARQGRRDTRGLTALDFIVIVAYLGVATALGIWVGRRQRDAKDYF